MSNNSYVINQDGQQITVVGTNATIMDLSNSNDSITSYQSGDSHATITIGSGTSNEVFAGSFDTIIAGDGNNRFHLESNDTLTAGNGNNTVFFDQANITNATVTVGNGNNTIVGTSVGNVTAETFGSLTVNLGNGTNNIDFQGLTGSSLTINQASGANAASIINFAVANINAVTVNVGNAGDLILTNGNGAVIKSLTLNVNVDGYKTPYAATTVKYGATNEAIAAPYNVAQPLPYFIDHLLFDPVPRWTVGIGNQATPVTVTFSMMQSLPLAASASDMNGFATLGGDLPAGMSPAQILAANNAHTITLTAAELSAMNALAAWAQVVNVNWVSAKDAEGVDVRFGENSQGSASSGYAYLPLAPLTPVGGAGAAGQQGTVYLSKDGLTAADYLQGGVVTTTFAHEIGHTLGLGGETGNSDPYDVVPYGEDLGIYTVMSYNATPPYPSGPMIYDIAAATYLYGPNPNYHPNATHVWNFTSSGGIGNLIIDGGGSVNTISAAGVTSALTIDLRPGHWSFVGSAAAQSVLAPNQLWIGYGTAVNDATAGSGTDLIICNDGTDLITGGAGKDTIVTAGGNDTINGGSGTTNVIFADPKADYTISTQNGVTTVTETTMPARGTEQGTDTLTNVQTLTFADGTVTLSASGGNTGSTTGTVVLNGTASVILGEAGNNQLTAPATVTDSASNIASNLDALQGLASSGKLAAIGFTDKGFADLTITPTQLTGDSGAIGDITGNFYVTQTASGSNLTIAGLSGHGNVVAFANQASQYSVASAGDGVHFTVTDNSSGSVDQLSNINALQFNGGSPDIVAATPSTSSVTSGNLTELYGAVFGRLPDVPGLAFYQGVLKANPSTPLLTFAGYFLASPEYANAHNYPQTTAGDTQFITDSYQNLLGRAPASGDAAYYENNVIAPYLNGLTAGTDAYTIALAAAHAQVLVYFSASAEFLGDVQITGAHPADAKHWLYLI